MNKPRPAFPALYATLYRTLVDLGAEMGYAMALHGSLNRDMDVVAVPWTEEAASADELVAAIRERIGVYSSAELRPDTSEPERKPHGRLGWSLVMAAGAFIDLSVMPRTRTPEAP